MSFDWTKFISLAEELIKQKHADEASWRSGISRAYYGVFCIARNKKGLKNYYKANVHKNVIKQYQDSYNRDEKYIGTILDKLRKERNKADYDEKEKIDSELAQRVILKAKEVLKKLGVHQ